MYIPADLVRLVLSRDISDSAIESAAQATIDFLKRIDIHRVEEMRRGLELPPESLGVLLSLYVNLAIAPAFVGAGYAGRGVVPMNTDGVNVGQKKRQTVTSEKLAHPVTPERVFVSASGTEKGSADWLIHDIKVDGETVYTSKGALPGDMFATNAIESFVRWRRCEKAIAMDVEYVGGNPLGCPFYGSIIGPIG